MLSFPPQLLTLLPAVLTSTPNLASEVHSGCVWALFACVCVFKQVGMCIYTHLHTSGVCECTVDISVCVWHEVRPQRPGSLAAFLGRLCVCVSVCELGLCDPTRTHRSR